MAGTSNRDAYSMIYDYRHADREYERRDNLIAELQAQMDEHRREQDALVMEQERLTTLLGPALRESGPVCWKEDDGTFTRIAFNPNEALLDVENLAPFWKVDLRGPGFDDALIREAAAHQALGDVAADDDTGEYEPVGVGAAVAMIDQEAS